MGLNKDTLERQLAIATEKLAGRVQELDEKNVTAENRRHDSQWRQLDASRRAVINRISAAEAVLAREAECAERKAAASAK
ncbi:MAG: hypothetical protein VB858_11345 [Planctomycetaceae bacterium]|jgi:hypothetical protein